MSQILMWMEDNEPCQKLGFRGDAPCLKKASSGTSGDHGLNYSERDLSQPDGGGDLSDFDDSPSFVCRSSNCIRSLSGKGFALVPVGEVIPGAEGRPEAK